MIKKTGATINEFLKTFFKLLALAFYGKTTLTSRIRIYIRPVKFDDAEIL